MLYSHNQKTPAPLPHRIVLSNGMTRTDKTTFTAEEIADAGYVAAPEKPTAQYPNKVDWDGTQWVAREPNQAEINAQIRSVQTSCESLLASTDYKVIKAMELGQPLDPAYTAYRQALRDLYNNIHLDPWNPTWPSLESGSVSDSAA